MENPRTTAFAQTAKTIIKQLERRNMEGYFCETSADAVELVRKLVPAGASIGEHRHETSTDVNFVLAGRGRAVTDGVPEPLAPRRLPRLQKGLHPRHRKHRGRGPRAAPGRLRTRKGRLGKGCDE